jgi:hypothetical protein
VRWPIFVPDEKTLLLTSLLGLGYAAHAQYAAGAASLITLGVRGLAKRDAPQQKATLFVLPATY